MSFNGSNASADEQSPSSWSLTLLDDSLSSVLGLIMEVTRECIEDPPEEHAESSLPRSTGYD